MIRQIVATIFLLSSVNSMALLKKQREQEAQQQKAAVENIMKVDPNEGNRRRSMMDGMREETRKACFKEGTLLVDEDGNSKAIESFQIGDAVLSFDNSTNTFINKRVDDVITLSAQSLVVIHLEDGRTIEVTQEHPLYSNQRGWIPAQDLVVGDRLKTQDSEAQIASIEIQSFDDEFPVYDLSIEDTHNYLVLGNEEGLEVGDSGILVHNCNTAKEFSAGVIVGAAETIPGVAHPPKGSSTFESGRDTGHSIGSATQMAAGALGMAGGAEMAAGAGLVVAGAAAAGGAGLAAAGAGIAAAGAAAALHGANVMLNQKLGKEPSAHTPVGRRGAPADFAKPNRNTGGEVNGRKYTDHAFDRMQERGYTPTVVENTIKTGSKSAGNKPGRSIYKDSINKLEVVVEDATGEVVSIIPK